MNLHSNMVIFIIRSRPFCRTRASQIYIPIWLYLLLFFRVNDFLVFHDLHSNMVIFIICQSTNYYAVETTFTFQYGYIYYRVKIGGIYVSKKIYIPIWLYLL